ncbi:Kelch repeat-containing protein [Maribacter halichondriae]|uniref:Kelch repeat-containing protein n=1 Tax=Maribacter halichondriae TaxID=2980554 RepID=UPI0023596E08|nr:hypothetical protein [Maribacter sp. Hal144]
MKTKYKYLFLTAIILIGCKNDDPVSHELELRNEPPLSFNLIDVADNSTNVDVLPTLSWESAKNPKGGEVTYDLYLGKEINPTTLYQSDIPQTSFEIMERLNLITEYYWKVVAKDSAGQTSQSGINKFSTRNLNFPETPVTANAAFPKRTGFASAAYDEKMWVIGGLVNNELKNDVWFSENGINWLEITTPLPFSPRREHSLVVFEGKLWLIGGRATIEDGAHLNDVWSTTNGISWTQETASAAFPTRSGHSTVVHDEKIWLLGGSGPTSIDDVWYSEDGINWIEALNKTPFGIRLHHTSMVFDDKLWVIGGAALSIEQVVFHKDIWYSADGANWTLATDDPSFPARNFETGFVFDDKMWLAGGLSNGEGFLNDVWFSSNGTDWFEAISKAPFSERVDHVSIIFKKVPWIIGGVGPDDMATNDIWILE